MDCVSGCRLASHWRCAAVSCGTATQGWRSVSRCASRTHNAHTGKRTALLRTPSPVWPSSTLSSPPVDETRGRAVPDCLGNRGIRLLFCTNGGRAVGSHVQNPKERCFLAAVGRSPSVLGAEPAPQRAHVVKALCRAGALRHLFESASTLLEKRAHVAFKEDL